MFQKGELVLAKFGCTLWPSRVLESLENNRFKVYLFGDERTADIGLTNIVKYTEKTAKTRIQPSIIANRAKLRKALCEIKIADLELQLNACLEKRPSNYLRVDLTNKNECKSVNSSNKQEINSESINDMILNDHLAECLVLKQSIHDLKAKISSFDVLRRKAYNSLFKIGKLVMVKKTITLAKIISIQNEKFKVFFYYDKTYGVLARKQLSDLSLKKLSKIKPQSKLEHMLDSVHGDVKLSLRKKDAKILTELKKNLADTEVVKHLNSEESSPKVEKLKQQLKEKNNTILNLQNEIKQLKANNFKQFIEHEIKIESLLNPVNEAERSHVELSDNNSNNNTKDEGEDKDDKEFEDLCLYSDGYPSEKPEWNEEELRKQINFQKYCGKHIYCEKVFRAAEYGRLKLSIKKITKN